MATEHEVASSVRAMTQAQQRELVLAHGWQQRSHTWEHPQSHWSEDLFGAAVLALSEKLEPDAHPAVAITCSDGRISYPAAHTLLPPLNCSGVTIHAPKNPNYRWTLRTARYTFRVLRSRPSVAAGGSCYRIDDNTTGYVTYPTATEFRCWVRPRLCRLTADITDKAVLEERRERLHTDYAPAPAC